MPSPKAPPEQGGGARWRIDRAQKSLLEEAFSAKRFPSPETKRRLADQLHVDVRRIQVWFQNRRQRLSAKEGGGGEQSSPPHELFAERLYVTAEHPSSWFVFRRPAPC